MAKYNFVSYEKWLAEQYQSEEILFHSETGQDIVQYSIEAADHQNALKIFAGKTELFVERYQKLAKYLRLIHNAEVEAAKTVLSELFPEVSDKEIEELYTTGLFHPINMIMKGTKCEKTRNFDLLYEMMVTNRLNVSSTLANQRFGYYTVDEINYIKDVKLVSNKYIANFKRKMPLNNFGLTYSKVFDMHEFLYDGERTVGEKIKEEIDKVVEIDLKLELLVRHGFEKEAIEILEQNIVSIDKVYGNGRTLLHLATGYCNTRLVAFIIDEGADLFAIDKFGKTPFFYAVKSKIPDIVSVFLRKIKNLSTLEQVKILTTEFGKNFPQENRTALIAAVSYNSRGTVNTLLKFITRLPPEQQFNILNARDKSGYSTLIIASLDSKDNIFEALLKFVGKFSSKQQVEILNAKDQYGVMVLNHAVTSYNKNTLKLLLKFIEKLLPNEKLSVLNAVDKEGKTAITKNIYRIGVDANIKQLLLSDANIEYSYEGWLSYFNRSDNRPVVSSISAYKVNPLKWLIENNAKDKVILEAFEKYYDWLANDQKQEIAKEFNKALEDNSRIISPIIQEKIFQNMLEPKPWLLGMLSQYVIEGDVKESIQIKRQNNKRAVELIKLCETSAFVTDQMIERLKSNKDLWKVEQIQEQIIKLIQNEMEKINGKNANYKETIIEFFKELITVPLIQKRLRPEVLNQIQSEGEKINNNNKLRNFAADVPSVGIGGWLLKIEKSENRNSSSSIKI